MAQSRITGIDSNASHSRRSFLVAGATAAAIGSKQVHAEPAEQTEAIVDPALRPVIAELESYFTPQDEFQDVSRGKPIPHRLPAEKLAAVGLSRETWKLDVVADPEQPPRIRRPLSSENGTAFTFADLMRLAKSNAVRFPKVMTCLNIGCPLGTGIWEGVPLRDVIWLTQPAADIRRVFYYGYHNDDPEQMFRSSLPVGRVLEDPFGLPPVILCYKLNGQWLSPDRGGPVRIVVPEAYGFKSIKWLSHVVLSNLHHANDTYAEQNNDVDSPLKTFAATLSVPKKVKANTPIPVTGYAQVGISGLSKVQVWITRSDAELPAGDRYYTKAPWQDAQILPPPTDWGGGLPDGKVPLTTKGFHAETGQPITWPMPLTKIHWAKLLPGLPAGEYTLRSRTIDASGIAQPMPRPFRKSGHSAIEQVEIVVEA